MIATALALVGTSDGFITDSANLMPYGGNSNFRSQTGPIIYSDAEAAAMQQQQIEAGGPSLLLPMSLAPTEILETSAQRQLEAYTIQLGGIPIGQGKPLVTPPKFYYERR